MRRLILGLGALGLALAVFSGVGLADDPPAPPAPPAAPVADAARLKQLVENLGSDDFRIREEASKELSSLGEKARPVLEEARKSDTPEVRFRADQLLRRLDKSRGERRLDDGSAGGGGSAAGGGGGAAPGGRDVRRRMRDFAPGGGAGGFDMEEWAKRLREQIDALQREAESFGSGRGGMGFGFPGLEPFWNSWGGAGFSRTLKTEAGTLLVTPRGVRLSVVDRAADGSQVTATYEGKSLEAILSAHPSLKSRAGIDGLVDQAKKAVEDAKKAQEEARGGSRFGPGGFSFRSDVDKTQVEVGPNGAKVTITETGPDGKPVTKTYEGADLDTIKREHPEIADKIGNFSVKLGPVPPGARGMPDDDDGPVAPRPPAPPAPPAEPSSPTAPQGGRFGIAYEPGTLTIRSVRSGSDAASMGLQPGDVIVSVNGRKAEGGTLPDLLRAAGDSGSYTIEILRGGAPTTITWTKSGR